MTPVTTIVMKKDLANLIRSTWQTHQRTAAYVPADYTDGFLAALAAIATACDLDSPVQMCGSPEVYSYRRAIERK